MLLVWIVVAGGCGYKLAYQGKVDSLYIETFKNRTFEHGIETVVTDKLIREFIYDGRMKILQKDVADAVLEGEIIEFRLEPYTYGATEEDVRQHRVWIKAHIRLVDTKSGEVIWEDTITGDAKRYLVGGMAVSREKAEALAAEDLAKNVIERVGYIW